MEHYLIRATIIPEVVKMIQERYQLSENAALDAFYRSSIGDVLADDDTGLYGQSPLYIFGLFAEEYNEE